MPVDHIVFNLDRGIDGIAQSPSQAKNLEVLPQSQQVLPSNSLFIGMEANGQSMAVMQGASNWHKTMQDFVMPNIASNVLVPSELKARLDNIRKRIHKKAHKENDPALLALAEALQDDADLQAALHIYRSALVQA